MGILKGYFESNPGRLIHKWTHYLEVYEAHFERFRGREVHVMEIGVYYGGSLQMWKHYFGPEAHVYGVDINPACRQFEEERVRVLVGDQADRGFLRSVRAEIPRVDILIDDGGHRMDQQIVTFEELFPHISEDGIYLCEDLHTSYLPEFGGGYRRSGTFIETAKGLVDKLNAWHTREPDAFEVDDFTLSAHSLHFYPGMLVIEKRRMQMPHARKTGVPGTGR
jgi:cephalosporin hydroxylase